MPTEQEIASLKEKLIEACDKHLADGGNLVYSSFTDRQRGKCPLTCLYICASEELGAPSRRLPNISDIAEMNISSTEAWAFVNGFDGNASSDPDMEGYSGSFYQLGKELRKKYIG